MIDNLISGFAISLSYSNLLVCLLGCTLGTIIGVLPGLGPAATISILLMLTYKMDLTSAIIMLSGIYYGAQYGGTITSVLFQLPGEASTVVTTFDGYQMALQGKAGKALGIAAYGSFFAGTLCTIALSILAPPLAKVAIMFGPPEYSALMFLGLTLVIYLGSGSVVKGVLMGGVGLALSTIGMDPVTAFERFNFGSQTLVEGVNMALLAMGLFGIGEILYMAGSPELRSQRDTVKCPSKLKELLPDKKEIKVSAGPICRGSILGFFLGILPGGGATVASFVSYAFEKRISRHPETFGKGEIAGVAAPESANNAAVSGCFIPLLTLGIPSNVVMALLMGAFILHGVIPGPFILEKHPDVFWGLITSMYIGNVILLILNIPFIRLFVKFMEVPYALLSPLIIVICTIGAYSLNYNPVEVSIMFIFGIIGYLLKKLDYEVAPLMLAFVLGELFEKSVRQSLILSHGTPLIFLTRPISAILLGIALVLIVFPIFTFWIKHSRLISVLRKGFESR
jgi:putative tricarboxylic transport membrane protein